MAKGACVVKGACMAKGGGWACQRGACVVKGGMCGGGACMAGEMVTAADGMHPTGNTFLFNN